ncbi:hypothetical protein QYE76_060675 [Lolium multiflorum]|uniref:Transposase (putative) gypsy type domain-containing protein n=1 Tax=Lolium multiflorum TaxID=4521 RepID=A0AAD8S1R5_LOLMU|nr:hypothetical protein QYE76_060675 [Lolium multiflorum]
MPRIRGVFFLLALTSPLSPFELSRSDAFLRRSLANFGERSPRRSSAELPPQPRQSGVTGPRASTARPSPPRSPPARSGSSSPFRLSWTSSSSSSSMAQPSGSWKGSYMQEDDIARLVRLRRIPAGVITRAPGAEMEPKPEPGERVVFGAHLDRGLGLPASNFFRRFLDFFGLQPHHLPANAMILLSCYVVFMEGYAGLWPDVEFWSRLFYIKAQTTEGRLRTCGAASIYPRTGTSFPRIPTVDSVKNWQMSFFYVRNESPAFDRLNLPEYNPAPPVGRLNWGHNPKSADPDAEVNLLWDFLGECVTGGRLSAEDLLCTYVMRRVIPLQWRVHKIGHMSGRLDPTRTSKVELSKSQVARRVNNITKANMPDNWDWGLPPYDREQPPELLFTLQGIEDGDLAMKVWTPDHVDPADPAGDQAGDDDLPEVPDQGGQGEHNPPPSPEHEQEQPQAEPAESGTGPIPAVPLRTRPPASTATSAPKGKKRAIGGSTAALEAKAKKQRRHAPKKVPEQAGVPIQFTQGGGSRQAPPVTSPLQRQRRSQPRSLDTRAHAACCCRAACGYAAFCGGVFFSCAFCGAWRRCPGACPAAELGWRGCAAAARVGGPAPNDVVVESCPEGAPQAPETTAPTGPTASTAPPPSSEPTREEPARDEPARAKDAGSRALVRTEGPPGPSEGLHVAKGARLLHVPRGQPGAAPMKMLFSGYRASLKNKVAEALAQLATLEDADKLRPPGSRSLSRTFESPALNAPSEEANRAAAAKLKVADGELKRLRLLEANHLKELAALKKEQEEKLEGLSKRLEEVERQRLALQEEVTSKSNELSATAKRWLGELSALDRGLAAAFPEAQEAALAAVGRAREERRQATGEQSSDCFTMDDYLSSMAARVEPITKLGWELRKAAEELIRLLWPTETLPQDLSNLIAWLDRAPDRFLDWKESAARAGADMALSFVLSWYNEVSLDQLEYRRADVEDKLPAENKTARLARACAIADFVDKAIFIADPNPPSDDEEEAEDEEADDVPEDDPAAGSADAPPAGPAPAGA